MTDVYDPGPFKFLVPDDDTCLCFHPYHAHYQPSHTVNPTDCQEPFCKCPEYEWDSQGDNNHQVKDQT